MQAQPSGIFVEKQDKFDLLKQVTAVSTVPLLLVGGPLLGYFAGDWIDHRYAADPYGKCLLIALGIAASIREIIKIIQNILKSEK